MALSTNSTLTIASGESLSQTVDLGNLTITGFENTGAWTTANLTFKTSQVAGSSVSDAIDQFGNEITVSMGSARSVSVSPTLFPSVRFIQLRSGTSATPVNQGGTRTIILTATEFRDV